MASNAACCSASAAAAYSCALGSRAGTWEGGGGSLMRRECVGADIPQSPEAPAAHQQCRAYRGGSWLLPPAPVQPWSPRLGSAGAVWGVPCHTPLAGPSWLVYEAFDGKQQQKKASTSGRESQGRQQRRPRQPRAAARGAQKPSAACRWCMACVARPARQDCRSTPGSASLAASSLSTAPLSACCLLRCRIQLRYDGGQTASMQMPYYII